MSNVAVIGGGPAGMLAAATAAKNGHSVTLLEQNEKLGKKLYLTGKGRCNLTNSADIEDFFQNIPRNPKFLYSALYGFTNADIVSLIERMGVPTKIERGGRVFPMSDKSSDVLRALVAHVKECGVSVRLNTRVTAIEREGEGFLLTLACGVLHTDALIICTGGRSYPTTGSTGDGYAFAKEMGHTVTPIKPSLIGLVTKESWPHGLSGLTLKNVTLTVTAAGKKVFSELGELLFTHTGVSGPLALSASSRIADKPEGVELSIDLKPGLTIEELDRRILRDFQAATRKQLQNALGGLLPINLIPVIMELAKIAPDKPVNAVTREERERLCALLKGLPLTVARTGVLDEAIITRGGIAVKEINASTMESKLVPNLFFAGEVLDVDAYTGGFNLQIAYSTGVLAGNSVK